MMLQKKVHRLDLISVVCIVFGPAVFGLSALLNKPAYSSILSSVPGTIIGFFLGLLAIASIPASVIFAALAKSAAKKLNPNQQTIPWIVLILSILYAAIPLIVILFSSVAFLLFIGLCAVHPGGACT